VSPQSQVGQWGRRLLAAEKPVVGVAKDGRAAGGAHAVEAFGWTRANETKISGENDFIHHLLNDVCHNSFEGGQVAVYIREYGQAHGCFSL
jgi:hypothetical protein